MNSSRDSLEKKVAYTSCRAFEKTYAEKKLLFKQSLLVKERIWSVTAIRNDVFSTFF